MDNDSIPTLMGRYKVPHFDAKGESDKYFLDSGVPTTVLYTVFYWENMIYLGAGPTRREDGKLAITFPMGDKKLPAIAVEDIGKVAYNIFKSGDKYTGKVVGISGDQPTGQEMAEGLSEIVGEEVVYQDVPADVYRSFGFQGADDMGNMYQFKRDYNDYFTASRDVEFTRSIFPELMGYKQWLEKYGNKIPLK
jgi:uncharacterized protein YbjT (DUF2867 family)